MRHFLFAALAMVTVLTGTSMGAVFGPAGSGPLQDVLDDITVAPVAGSSSVDVTTDELSDVSDSHWSITGSGGSFAQIIIELAAFADDNIFGVYDPFTGTKVAMFGGGAGAGDKTVLSFSNTGEVEIGLAGTGVFFSGNVFGFYLDSSANAGGGVWYSDSSLNSDGTDHMYAYQGTDTDTIDLPGSPPGLWTDNEFALAFEDLDAGSTGPIAYDGDFTDFVVMVESVNPIPEPLSLLCWGGLIGLVGLARFTKKQRLA